MRHRGPHTRSRRKTFGAPLFRGMRPRGDEKAVPYKQHDVMVTAFAGGKPLPPSESPGVAAEDCEGDPRRVPPDQDRPALQGGTCSDSQGVPCVEQRDRPVSWLDFTATRASCWLGVEENQLTDFSLSPIKNKHTSSRRRTNYISRRRTPHNYRT